MRKLNRKGQILENISGIAIGVGTLALVLVIVFLINAGVKDQTVDDITTTSFSDVAKTLTNATALTFAECIDDEDLTVTSILNGTGVDCIAIGAANYTISGNVVTVTFDEGGTESYEASTNATYNCKTPSTAYNSTGTLNNDTYSLVGWISLIIIVLIGILILGLVRMIRP